MAGMTPGEEAAYALRWDLARDSLDPAVQLEYDRLKLERGARPRIQAATPRTTEPEPRDPGPFPWLWYWRRTGGPPVDVLSWLATAGLIAGLIVWAGFIFWLSEGANITGYHMNFRTLRSDISKVHLPAGYEKVSSSESGRDCREQRCTLMEFWVWRADGAHTAADACRDLGRAMGTGLPGVDAEPRPYRPRGAACEYDTILDSFFHRGDGKRSVDALVWVNGMAKGSPGGYKVELLAAYNYWAG